MKKLILSLIFAAAMFAGASMEGRASCNGTSINLCWSDFEQFTQDYQLNCESGDVVHLEMVEC